MLGCHTNVMLKGLDEMTLGREREVVCNLNISEIGKAQKILCFFDFFFADIIADRYTEILFEKA